MKVYWGSVSELHTFLALALDGGELSDSQPVRFTPGKEPLLPIG